MKNNLIVLGTFILLILSTLYSCGKSESRIYLDYDQEKIYSIDLSKDSLFTTKKGIKVIFSEELIKNLQAKYNTLAFKFIVEEYYTPSDFFLKSLPTITKKGQLLESQGMFNITFKENHSRHNHSNYLNTIKGLRIEVPVNTDLDPKDFKKFEGIREHNDQEIFSWTNAQDIAILSSEDSTVTSEGTYDFLYDTETAEIIDSVLVIDTSEPKNDLYYNFTTSNLSWINIDRFINLGEENLTKIKVKIDEDFNYVQTGIIFHEYNSYLSLKTSNSKTFVHELKLPIGTEVSIISVGKKKNEYYISTLITRVSSETKQLKFEKINEIQIPTRIKEVSPLG